MSLLHVEHRDARSFGIWHITESESELETLSGCTAPSKLTNPSRKPYLKDSTLAISLSHTKHYAAIVVSNHPLIGIDIEQRTERVERVRHKFMHPQEEAALEASGIDTLTGLLMHWCTKEAVFKAVPEVDIDFAKEIRVTHLPDKQTTGEATFIRTQTTFQLEVRSTPDFVMVICHAGVIDLSASK